ncbi:MAG: class III poly(R)-hydroxyalkanoic acid synthase subunit PhaC [Lachnospiraceae bacterium]|nr:class III poly(R)-hydroxyalkanoic acid synthase subunit PhaC [Lachnospiraceae bacterium]
MADNNVNMFDFQKNFEKAVDFQKDAVANMAEIAQSFDYKKIMDEVVDYQKELVDGIKTVMELKPEDLAMDQLEKDVVFSIGTMKLYHYKPLVAASKICKTPTLVCYALVNRQYMMDLQPDRSVFKNFLENGLDLYVIDWGYPTGQDMYLTLDDYINWYLDDCVEFIKKEKKVSSINLYGICQGGTFSTIYTATHPKNIKNLVTMVVPIDFSPNDGLLMHWGKYLNIDNFVAAYNGVVPGDIMNFAFVILKPLTLTLNKYVTLVEKMSDKTYMENNLRMEAWTFDSPNMAGEALKEFNTKCYVNNELIQNKMVVGDKKVDLKKITCPLLVCVAEKDHLVPPACSRPFMDAVGSKDKEYHEFPTGHIGMFTSSRSRKEIMPTIIEWMKARD